MIWSLLGTVAKGAIDVVKTRTETKKLLAKAEQTHAMKMAEGKIDFEIAAQKNMKDSWRDEWFTILLSIPLVIVFISIFFNKPEWVDKLKEGFDTLNSLPDWYIYALMAAIASSFGIKITDLAIKKFKK
jgi:ABC-type transport system involved in multi-copper enzyme maturation permease subunit